MNGGGGAGRTRIATVLGISVAVGALLVLALVPAASSALRPELQGVVAASDSTCHVGGDPQFPGYDPVNHEVYVPNFTTGNISVLKGTCTLAGTIKLPKNAEPYQALFDPANNYMFVTDFNLAQIYEISGTKVIYTFTNSSLGGDLWAPAAMAYDPEGTDHAGGPGALVVTNFNGDFITWFQTYEGGYFGTIPVGQSPDAIAFNPTDGDVWVANSGSDNDTVLNINWYYYYYGTSEVGSTEASLSEGSVPDAVTVDQANGYVYVADFGTNNVSVWNGAVGGCGYDCSLGTIEFQGVISGFDGPSGATWDQSTLEVYVTSLNNNKVYSVGGGGLGLAIFKKYSVPADSFPTGVAYDAANGDMYVTCVGTNSVYVIA